MDDAQPVSTSRKQLPSWVVAIAIVASGGATAWAAWQTGLRGPQLSWQTATQAVSQVWPGQMLGGSAAPVSVAPAAQMPGGASMPPAAQMPGGASMPPAAQMDPRSGAPPYPGTTDPSATALGAGSQVAPGSGQVPQNAALAPSPAPMDGTFDPTGRSARTVAGLPGVPQIFSGAQRPHSDRGACTQCHTVLKGDGRPTPNIASFSVRPHEYRGVCSNCHQIVIGGNPVAAIQAAPLMGGNWSAPPPAIGAFSGMPPDNQQAMPQQQAMARPPNEADWRGMEVRPADQGVVVTKSEGAAGRAGVQPGDVVTSINGKPVGTIADFVGATENGRLGEGTIIARRNAGRVAFEIQAGAGQAMNPGMGQMTPQNTFQAGPMR